MKIKQALLFTPPFPAKFMGMPMGLLTIGSALERKGMDVKIIDLASHSSGEVMKKEEWQRIVMSFTEKIKNPENCFIGITVFSPGLNYAIELANFIRKNLGKCLIAFGGPHFYNNWKLNNNSKPDFLENSISFSIDWVYYGQILPIEDFSSILNGELQPNLLPNLSFRTKDGISYSKSRNIELTDDHLMLCNYNLLTEPKLYTYRLNVQGVQLSTSFGCTYPCIFCSSARTNSRVSHSINSIRKRLEEIDQTNTQFVFFDDPTFTENDERTDHLLKILSDMRFKWACQTRINAVTRPNLLRRMKNSGCDYIFYGIETGDLQSKKKIGKNISNDLVVEVIKATIDNEIQPAMSLMFGIPDENDNSLTETWKLIEEIDNSVKPKQELEPLISPCFYAVYPGTAAETLYKKTFNKELDYINSYSSETIWLKFDDGFGACHHLGPEYAEKVYEQLLKTIKGCQNIKIV